MTYLRTISNPKTKSFAPSSTHKKQPTSYGAQRLESPVNTRDSASYTQGKTSNLEPVMQKKRYTTPFAQFICKDVNGYYNVRLGPKIYLAKVSLNYTPEFDAEFFGGAQAAAFDWHSILVKETPDSQPRPINEDELAMYWFKGNIRKIVNYQRAIERRAKSQTPRYSKEQRIAYRNAQYNGA
ncbi:hypothetical protein QTA56_03620 [Acinetobacter sp. VNH17]|uniref:Uncharacterized protein n=1 Tax=Acinetobacter thutiue TaxID=2998078 RepID=A0ABT7WKW6_9GAMM|nr:hypothetical protein [Acinetobacter thutiue]MCY6411228.1 hypothetical protein [Acinetobacter thutiue]MDN0013330.1 hypothetical protein [Acinetobacter thutiue]